MHQQRAALGSSASQHTNGFGVHLERLFAFAFSLVHGGVGASIDDYIRGEAAHGFGQTRKVRQVTTMGLAARAQRQHLTKRRQATLQLPAYLAIFAQ